MRPRQRRFCNHYLQSLNASDAARKAGYSKKNADVVGPRLLVNVGIREYINKRLNDVELSAMTGLKHKIGRELEVLAFGSGREKIKALEILAKYAGMLTNDVRVHVESDPNDEQVAAFMEKHGLGNRS